MTVIELVERERARLRMLDAAAAVALALVATLLIIGTGCWLLGEGRWIVLPRGTPMLVWAALLLANGAVFVWASRRLRRELARPGVAAAIEREQTLRAGAVRGVIEVADSGALGRRADRRLSAELETRGPRLAPAMQRASRVRAIRAFAVSGVTLALLLWAAPALHDG